LSLPVRLALAVVVALLGLTATANADVLAIKPVTDHVAPGQTLKVVVTPDAAPDGMSFHGARLFVMQPGQDCPTDDFYPEADDLAGSESTGPFSTGDSPMTVSIQIKPDAKSGPTHVCSLWWSIALSLAGDAFPGPAQDVSIDPKVVATSPAKLKCAIDPDELLRGHALLLLNCGKRAPSAVQLRMTCTSGPKRKDRTIRLDGGAATVTVDGLRGGRCAVSVRARGKVVGRRTMPVR
jgi:hypothetical protein